MEEKLGMASSSVMTAISKTLVHSKTKQNKKKKFCIIRRSLYLCKLSRFLIIPRNRDVYDFFDRRKRIVIDVGMCLP